MNKKRDMPQLGSFRDYPTAGSFPNFREPQWLGLFTWGVLIYGDKTMGWIEIAFFLCGLRKIPSQKKSYCPLLPLPPVAKRPQTGVGIWNF